MYKVENEDLISLPETPKEIKADFLIDFNGYAIPFSKEVVYKYNDPVKGEVYKPFVIIPEASAKFTEKVIVFSDDQEKEVPVIVKAGKDNLEGFVSLAHPKNWTVYPEKQPISIAHKGEEQTVLFQRAIS